MQRSSAMLQMLTPIATRLRSAMATAGDETLHLYDTIDLMDGAVSPLAASTQLPTATQDDEESQDDETPQMQERDDAIISAGESTLVLLANDTTWPMDGSTANVRDLPSDDHAAAAGDDTPQQPPSVRPKGTVKAGKNKRPTRSRGTKAPKEAAQPNTTSIICFTKCNRDRKSAGEMTRCNMCMIWFHDKCAHITDDDRTGLWMCPSCRKLPVNVDRLLSHVENLTTMVATVEPVMRQLVTDFKNLQETNSVLINTLASKVDDLTNLARENGALREQLKTTQERYTYAKAVHAPTTNRSTLVIGTSFLKHMKSTKDSVNIESYPGSCISDLTQELSSRPENTYSNVVLQVGSNDCATQANPSDIVKNYIVLLREAKRVSQEPVTISTILPRLDNASAHHRARVVNERLRQGAHAGHFNLVDNDKNFYLMNSSIDDSLFWRDKLHLNKRGATRLIANFGLSDSVQVNIDKAPVINVNTSTVDSTSAYRGGTGASYRSAPGMPGTGRQMREATGGSRQQSGYGQARQGVNPPPDANRSRSDTSGGCVFCGERNHTWETCRHGTYITCDRCSRPGHKASRCTH